MKYYRIYRIMLDGSKKYFMFLRMSRDDHRVDWVSNTFFAFWFTSLEMVQCMIAVIEKLDPESKPLHFEEVA